MSPANRLGRSKIHNFLEAPAVCKLKITKDAQIQVRTSSNVVDEQHTANESKYRNIRKMPYCHEMFFENVIKDEFPTVKLLEAYEDEKRGTGRAFEEVLMETGCYIQSSWLVRVAVRFSQRSNEAWLDNFLRNFIDNSNHVLKKCFVEEVKNLFLKVYKNSIKIYDIWVGYSNVLEKENLRFDTLVVITHTKITDKLKVSKFCGLKVDFRDKNACSTEAKALLQHESLVPLNFQTLLSDTAIEVLVSKHSNVTILTQSGIKSRGFNSIHHQITMCPCVVIHCRVKGIVPFGESPFPPKIGEIPVDVREGFCDFASSQDKLQLGQRIGPMNNRFDFGTLGGFVDLPRSRKGFITCAHVVCPSDILQNGNVQNFVENNAVMIADKSITTPSEPVGKVKKAAFRFGKEAQVSVDAALIELHACSRFPENGNFAFDWTQDNKERIRKMGFSETNAPTFSNGETTSISSDNIRNDLIKCGAATGLTLGRLRSMESHAFIVNEDVKFSNNICKFYHQMEVIPLAFQENFAVKSLPPFISHGDSGSFVFMIVNNSPLVLKCVGLAIAVTSYGSCLMTPIDKVLSALGLPSDCLMKLNPSETLDSTSNGQSGVSEETLTRLLERMQLNISEELASLEQNINSRTAELAGRVSMIEQEMEEQRKEHRILPWFNSLCSIM
ncbi:uncharacterized protein LOC134268345 [Saccostrea cucullata]|uniref:uncharacterized protein LOC134268345 n=1 Tax=Saccostrea cuccullata TaxID=36930 RepID=UPI002ED475D9